MKKNKQTHTPPVYPISTGELEAQSLPVWTPDHILRSIDGKPVELSQEHKEAIAKTQREHEVWVSAKKPLAPRDIRYESNPPRLVIDGEPLFLDPSEKWALLGICMFARHRGDYIDWTDMYRAMTSSETSDGLDKQKMVKERRMVSDAADTFNEKIRGHFQTDDDIIHRKNYALCRMFGPDKAFET